MKKNNLLSDEILAFQPIEAAAGEGALQSDRTHDIEFSDDGDPYQLALNAAVVSSGEVYAAKPVASIATLANYLVTGFWQYNNTCLLYTSPSPRDGLLSRMPSSA